MQPGTGLGAHLFVKAPCNRLVQRQVREVYDRVGAGAPIHLDHVMGARPCNSCRSRRSNLRVDSVPVRSRRTAWCHAQRRALGAHTACTHRHASGSRLWALGVTPAAPAISVSGPVVSPAPAPAPLVVVAATAAAPVAPHLLKLACLHSMLQTSASVWSQMYAPKRPQTWPIGLVARTAPHGARSCRSPAPPRPLARDSPRKPVHQPLLLVGRTPSPRPVRHRHQHHQWARRAGR